MKRIIDLLIQESIENLTESDDEEPRKGSVDYYDRQ